MEKQIKVIICADDGEWSRENTDALASRGAQVVTVNRNGTALLTKIRDEKPDVVVMDLFMAGMDALGVMHAVKTEGLPKPVFIITAAYSSNTLERQIMEAGADYYAIQPFSKIEIIDRIFTLAGTASHGRHQPQRPAHSGHGDPAPDRRAGAHQGIPLPPGFHHHGHRRPGDYQCGDKAAVPECGKAVRDHELPCGARHSPRDRSRLGPRRCGRTKFVFRLHHSQHARQAHEQRVHRHDLR